MTNYEWLCSLNPCSFSIERNEHACSYVTARQWIEDFGDDWSDVSEIEIEAMKATNTIYRLQIYTDTPVGFNVWYGATLDSVINQAREATSAAAPANTPGSPAE